MKGIILAAGRGSRMGHLTDEKPKCLISVNGKPLIEHQITTLVNAGIKDIAIVTGYQKDFLKNYGNYHFFNSNWSRTNMVFSLLCAKEWLQEANCIVSYSDILYEEQIVRDLMFCEDDIAIAYDPNWLSLWSKRFADPLDDAETFRTDENNFVIEIGLKPNSVDNISGQYMGLLKFNSGTFLNCFSTLSPNEIDKIDMTKFLYRMILNGFKIKAVANKRNWFEFDSESDISLVLQG